jgi:NTE family protein
VATDLDDAREHWFADGPLVPALMASAALPAVYPPHVHDGRTFIDGGVLNEVHTERALALGATELYVLHVGHLDERRTDVQRPFDSALRAYWTARRWRLEENLRQIPEGRVLHRLPAGTTPRLRFDDFTQGPDLAEIAYDQTAEYLATGRLPTESDGSDGTAEEHDDGAFPSEPPSPEPPSRLTPASDEDSGDGDRDDGAIASTP